LYDANKGTARIPSGRWAQAAVAGIAALEAHDTVVEHDIVHSWLQDAFDILTLENDHEYLDVDEA
jgi:hypothetical protein